MAEQIGPGVYWIDGGASNLYLCEDGEAGMALVDTGMPRRQNRVWEALAELGKRPSDLDQILITHADIDHAGAAAAIQAESGATVYAGRETADFLRRGKSPQHMPRLIQFFIDHFVSYQNVPDGAIETVEAGQTLPLLGGVQVLATPGHTMDHLAFYSPARGVLFAGDALNTRNDELQRTPSRITADEAAATRSAVKLLELTPAVFACGHGRPFTEHTNKDVMQLFDQLRREQQP